jgi:hypothetical protein
VGRAALILLTAAMRMLELAVLGQPAGVRSPRDWADGSPDKSALLRRGKNFHLFFRKK